MAVRMTAGISTTTRESASGKPASRQSAPTHVARRLLLASALCTGVAFAVLAGCDGKQPAPTPAKADPPAKSDSPAKSGTPQPKPSPNTPPTNPTTTPVHGKPQSGLPIEEVKIAGRTFKLELAATNPTREKGLSDRTSIDAGGGMLFAFPDARRLSFVMRDCPIAIDILFLDPTGRIVAQHRMKPEEPRRPGENDTDYERRLKLYPSGYGAQFAIELKEGTLDQLKLKDGDQIKLDLDRLKRTAK